MKANHLVSVQPVRHHYHKGTSRIRHDNVLAQQFEVDKPNQFWISDVTCIRTKRDWRYLDVVLDFFSQCRLFFSVSIT